MRSFRSSDGGEDNDIIMKENVVEATKHKKQESGVKEKTQWITFLFWIIFGWLFLQRRQSMKKMKIEHGILCVVLVEIWITFSECHKWNKNSFISDNEMDDEAANVESMWKKIKRITFLGCYFVWSNGFWWIINHYCGIIFEKE